MISGRTAVYGLLGHPVAHSRSPEMHNRWFREHDVDAVYVTFPWGGDGLPNIADAVRTLGLRGCNLTVPLKERVVSDLDSIDGVGRAIGAVNTVLVDDQGALHGMNTDAPGLVRGIESHLGAGGLVGKVCVVMGAGGAGKAAVAGLVQAGASKVVVLNRTVPTAQQTLDQVRSLGKCLLDVGELSATSLIAQTPDVVVNALSGPGAEAIRGWNLGTWSKAPLWVDMNYWMPSPPLVDQVRAMGGTVQGGLPMLVWQGAYAFAHFTGLQVDPKPLLQEWQQG